MAESSLDMTVAILATDGVEQVELTQPRQALTAAGAQVNLVALGTGPIQAMNKDINLGDTFATDASIDEVTPTDYQGLVLPGGVANPDTLRMNERAVAFVRGFFQHHKPVAAICHAPWLLVDAAVLEGRTLTSFRSLRSDLQNAGAYWVDREVVVDAGLITSRGPNDLDAFCDKVIEVFAQGRHDQQQVKPNPGA